MSDAGLVAVVDVLRPAQGARRSGLPHPYPSDRLPTVAILPWGNVIEDFLDTIGASVEAFATEMAGGWLFGYASALRSQGMNCHIIVFSRDAQVSRRLVNPLSEVVTIVLPASRWFRMMAKTVGDPDQQAPQPRLARGLRPLVPYLATPPKELARALAQNDITVLICQEYENPRFDIAVRVGKRVGCRVFGSFQGGPPPADLLQRRIRPGSIAAADGLVIAPAEEASRVVRTYGIGRSSIARIPNPLDLDEWKPEDREASRVALGLPSNAFIAVCHCRIDFRRKGLDILLEAWRMLSSRHPERDMYLHIFGSGAGNADMEADIARAPVRGLRWDRRYSRDRSLMRRNLSAADLYVLASRHEGSPVAPLEAMACGLPVILSTAPGCADILEGGEAHGGVIVAAGDATKLASEMERMLLSPERGKVMGAAARRRVEASVSTSAVGRKLAGFLQR